MPGGIARTRRQAWLRDELILALDLYLKVGRNPGLSDAEELSQVLRSIPIEAHLAEDPGFRNSAAVKMKISNFVSIDPGAKTAGMRRGGRGDRAVWEEFANDPQLLADTANAIRRHLAGEIRAAPASEAPAQAPEGAILTRVHLIREREPKLVAARKAVALNQYGTLSCEACGFDFGLSYGSRGAGFIECHHTRPLSKLQPGAVTRLDELVLLCSNCHRMVHRRAPWLTMGQLRDLLENPDDA